MKEAMEPSARASSRTRLLRLIGAGLAGALSAFAMPVAQAPAKSAPPVAQTAPSSQTH